MGLSELVTTAPEASACMEIVPPVCKTRIFLGMIYSLFLKCGIIIVSQKGEIGIGWKSKLFFDIDGTLVNNRKSVLKSTKDAIKIVKEQGVLVGVATGRGPFLLRN